MFLGQIQISFPGYILNPDLQDFPKLFLPRNIHYIGKSKIRFLSRLDIFYINVGQPSVVNICKDKNKSEWRIYSAGSSILSNLICFMYIELMPKHTSEIPSKCKFTVLLL